MPVQRSSGGEHAAPIAWPFRRLVGDHGREQRSRDIIDAANDGVWILDARLVTVFVNRRMADMLGYTVEGMSERPLSDFIAADARDETEASLRRPGPPAGDHTRYLKKDGSALYATVSSTRAFGEDGTFMGVLKIVVALSDAR